MKILIFGISNVGKTTIGIRLAERINFSFYDLDDEVTKTLSTTIESFVNNCSLQTRDSIRCSIVSSLLAQEDDFVLAITPISYIETLENNLLDDDVLCIQLTDDYQNIFDRLVFSDENDIVYKDDEYKNKHRDHYIREIVEDQIWYGSVYSNIPVLPMNGMSVDEVVETIIATSSLDKEGDL